MLYCLVILFQCLHFLYYVLLAQRQAFTVLVTVRGIHLLTPSPSLQEILKLLLTLLLGAESGPIDIFFLWASPLSWVCLSSIYKKPVNFFHVLLYPHKNKLYDYPSIHSFPLQGHRGVGAGACPSCYRIRGGVHLRQVANLLQG